MPHRRRRISPFAGLAIAGSALTAAAIGTVEVSVAAVATPPDTPPSTDDGPQLVDGSFTSPDGTFTVRFAEAPAVLDDPPGYLAAAAEDAETITTHALDAFGGSAELSADERARRFIDASGTSVELLANTPTRLGPYPAAYFIARLDLNEGGQGAVYGAVVIRGEAVDYVVYTDIGGDDPDTGRAFVESFTLLLPVSPPVGAVPAVAAPDSSIQPSVPDDAASDETAVASAPAATVSPAPIGATPSFDGRWWITFPATVGPTLRASSEDGFAVAEYRAVAGDDVLTVRVKSVPPGYDRPPASIDGFAGITVGADASEPTTVSGRATVLSTFPSGAAIVSALVVDNGDQIVTVAYADGGEPSPSAAEAFLASLGFA